MTEAIKDDRQVHFPRFQWTGYRHEVDERFAGLPDWMEDEIGRYLRALVFRKYLALDRTVLQILIVLYMLPPFLKTYCIISSLNRGSGVEREDYYRALCFVEKAVSHTLQGSEGTWASFSRLYMETVRLLAAYL
jgi:hypothetical protein